TKDDEKEDLNGVNDPDINFHYSLPSTSQTRTRLPATATVCDRYNVSDRAAAAITSAVLQDFGIIYKVDTFHVVDKNNQPEEKSVLPSNADKTDDHSSTTALTKLTGQKWWSHLLRITTFTPANQLRPLQDNQLAPSINRPKNGEIWSS
ncbi:hypothetical protein AVEN_214979-1, partial [Araneus ventricosus]